MGLTGRHDPAVWPQPKGLVSDVLSSSVAEEEGDGRQESFPKSL